MVEKKTSTTIRKIEKPVKAEKVASKVASKAEKAEVALKDIKTENKAKIEPKVKIEEPATAPVVSPAVSNSKPRVVVVRTSTFKGQNSKPAQSMQQYGQSNQSNQANQSNQQNQAFSNVKKSKDKIAPAMTIKELSAKTVADLRKMAGELTISNTLDLNKEDLIIEILREQTKRGGNIFTEGVLEVINDGSHGVLRSLKLLPGENDVYISGSQIKRFNLRQGDFVSGQARPPKEGERYLSLLRIEAINGLSPEAALSRRTFKSLTPIFPNEQLKLATDNSAMSTRIIDMLAPIGKGQRGMIVSPPKVGKTWLLKEIAQGISINHPDAHLIVVLVGERPEEVTDMERSVKGEVVASNFDEPPEDHTKLAELAIDRAKRIVEQGRDVVILMDSITRLARAYNIVAPPSGRTLSGGFDPVAIYPPKRFFGAARNFEEGGSLTIIATALVETGSRMDEVIFEEFKGTGNMELKLDRHMAQKRIYPSIDVLQSGTRNEDRLLAPEVLAQVWRVRRMLDNFGEDEATQILIERLKKTKDNKEFLATLHESI
jgi:transcription termination factor Rho